MSEDYQVSAAVTALRRTPEDDGAMDTQLLHGEVFFVDKEERGWAFGRARRDGYQGWVDMAALSQPVLIQTHRVSALRTYAYSKPDLKSAPVCLISLNAKIAAGRRHERYVEAQRLGWIFEGHLGPLDASEPDYVAVAERFVGTPYLWGGRESLGLDCSGLVQTALEAAGVHDVPRDSGDQEAWARTRWASVPVTADLNGLQRGDLMFWPGHVGIMVDAYQLLHANGHHMATVIEPVATAVRRIEYHHKPVSGVYRPPAETGWTGLV